jgi:hypothetical protein
MTHRFQITPLGVLVVVTLIGFIAWSFALIVGALAAISAPASISDQIDAVDSTRLLLTINELVSFGNRHVLSAPDTGIHPARDFLLSELTAIQQANPDTSITVYPHTFPFSFDDQTAVGENLVLVLAGTDPDAGAVLIGAHYDTRDTDLTVADSVQPGADDNASGVAAVLEIARILAQRPHAATVYCVLFSAEEEGRLGSLAFVRDVVQAQNVPLRAMINLDMIGVPVGPDGVRHDGDLRVYSAPPDDSPSRDLARLIATTAQTYVPDLTVTVYDTLDRPGRWGDHQSFSDAGYGAARLIEPVDDMTRTHNANDLPDYLDLDYLRHVTQVALAAVLTLGD